MTRPAAPNLLSGLFLLGLALPGLVGCGGGGPAATAQGQAHPKADPPELWLVREDGGTDQAGRTTFICADAAFRRTFVRTRPQLDGQPCKDTTNALRRTHDWALRCEAGGWPFALSSAAIGDETRDFRLDFTLTPIYPWLGKNPFGTVRQSRRFSLDGPCPRGWKVGDQAAPGQRPRRQS